MLTTHKISAELFYDSFDLIAIHSSLNDYALAYALNKHLGLRLRRNQKDRQLNNSISFPVFDWLDEVSDCEYVLFGNKCRIDENQRSDGLFEFDTSMRAYYLVQERKEVDYFLKICTDQNAKISQMAQHISLILGVVMAYGLEADMLKSKANLIF